MLKVTHTQSGQLLSDLSPDLKKKLTKRIQGVLTSQVTKWRQIVITSTWFSPIPSPTSLIIATWRKTPEGFEFTYGWINYKGDQSRAEWRKSLRNRTFEPQFFDRLDRIMSETLSRQGAGGGT